MSKTRVLVVEDSPTVRHRLVEVLNSDPDIELVGEAQDGKQAVQLCQQHRPDVISMDMALPIMSGLTATEYIMAHFPTPILVVSSSMNRGELFKIYDALAAGAVDVVEKPSGYELPGEWESRYLSAVKLVARIRVITHPRARLLAVSARARQAAGGKARLPPPGERYDVVAIGASTGGPGAIVAILRALPLEFQIPILIVLHSNEPFGTAFADWLDGQTSRRVAHPVDGVPVAAGVGCVMVAPSDRHLVVKDGRLRLTGDPERHSCRPSVDVLFESLAREYGRSAAACLLTGMGKDGALGLLRIREAGGFTIAQDQDSSVVYGMPREAALIGAARHILRLDEIAPRLAALQGLEMEVPS